MKKLSLFLSISAFAVLLIACGETDDDEVEAAPTSENVEETAEDESEETSRDTGIIPIKEVVEYDFGTLHVIRSDELEGGSAHFYQYEGPTINYNFNAVQIGVLEPSEDSEDYFAGQFEYEYYDFEEIVILLIDLEVENTVDETVTVVEPYGGRVVDIYIKEFITELSDDVSGVFEPNEVKNGRVIYNLYTTPGELVARDHYEGGFQTSKVEDADGNEMEDVEMKVNLWTYD